MKTLVVVFLLKVMSLAHKCDQIQGDESVPFPDFMTSARRELMPSEDFLVFFVGAISAIKSECRGFGIG